VKDVDRPILAFLEGAPVFFQPWWLEAVSPGAWDYVVAKRGNEVVAVLPYTFKIRLQRFRLIEMPPLTPYLGPWLRPSNGKYANRLGEEKDLMSELIKGLPPFARFHQDFEPSITNWLPFYWKGFEQTTRYTYRIPRTADVDAIWSETRDNVRTDVRKSQKVVSVTETEELDDFLRLSRLTFARQNKTLPYSEDLVRRVDAACAQRRARTILLARDHDGQMHAGVYLVSDKDTVFYLMGGGDPQLRNSGATSLLVWEGIQRAIAEGKQFDFEGSMIEPVERFVRSFGARQIGYFNVKKESSTIVTLYRLLWKWTHREN